jgi:pyrimidine-nucleoside phosphorylase
MAGQTPTLVPADRILYALRDHTATIESPYLIAASIMSKKLAEGLKALVLDVKTGSGAFLSRYADAKRLAQLMVDTGELAGTRTVALMTSMDQPLGRFAGNWVEVAECVELFQHFSPEQPFELPAEKLRLSGDLLALTHALAGWMLRLGGKATTPEEGAALSAQLLTDGSAYRHFVQMVELQSNDFAGAQAALADPAVFHKPGATRALTAARAGFVASMDCTKMGWAVQRLGAGRAHPGDPVGAHAGIEMQVKCGDRVEAGQTLVTLFAETRGQMNEPYEMIQEAISIADEPPIPIPLVREVVKS